MTAEEVSRMSAVFWIVIGVVVLAALCSGGGKKSTGSGEGPVRIDRMHYYDADDHECSVCGARFRGNDMTCPKCKTKFAGTRDDDDEFFEEMEIWDDDDD